KSHKNGQHSHSALFLLTEPAKAQAQLHGVDPGIGSCQAGIGNMHESNLSTEIVLAPQKVQSNGAAAGEINLRSSRRHLRISKERAAANLEIGNNAPMSIERPFESERSEEHTSELQSPYDLVCRLLLEKKKNR